MCSLINTCIAVSKPILVKKRGGAHGGAVYHIKPNVAITQDWKSFLSNDENKGNLTKFYTRYVV
jgi:hypothetical protein